MTRLSHKTIIRRLIELPRDDPVRQITRSHLRFGAINTPRKAHVLVLSSGSVTSLSGASSGGNQSDREISLKKRTRRSKNIEKQRNLKQWESGREKKKRILWSTQLRNSKCLTFVFYFYQLGRRWELRRTKTFSCDFWGPWRGQTDESWELENRRRMHFGACCRKVWPSHCCHGAFLRGGAHLCAVEHSRASAFSSPKTKLLIIIRAVRV